MRGLTLRSEAEKTRRRLERCFQFGVCSPQAAIALDAVTDTAMIDAAEDVDSANEDINAALLKGLGQLLREDVRLWEALERAAACHHNTITM